MIINKGKAQTTPTNKTKNVFGVVGKVFWACARGPLVCLGGYLDIFGMSF